MFILYINHRSPSLPQAHVTLSQNLQPLRHSLEVYLHFMKCLHFMVFEICFRKQISLLWILWDFFFELWAINPKEFHQGLWYPQ